MWQISSRLTKLTFKLLLLSVLCCFPYRNLVLAQNEQYKPWATIRCNANAKCPENWPCCSPYGECGAGPICLGSCNPRFSYNETSCAPMPALVPPLSLEYIASPLYKPGDETNLQQLENNGFQHFTKFLITDVDQEAREMMDNIDFTYSGPVTLDSATGDVILAMPKESSGSLLAATRSFLYGRSTVRLKTSRSRGVITSVVIMSAVGDEIDFEFLGSELDKVQSNYYFHGEPVYTKMKEFFVSSNTWATYHDYEIDWTEDRVHWIIDGVIVRTLKKEDTWDDGLQIYKYPQTPMRLEVALWPGGAKNNHPGTIDWAGGLIDWENAPDIIEQGEFTAKVESMRVTPYRNRYISAMDSCLETENHIAYDYISKPRAIFDETSFALYCGLVPNVPGWTKTGYNIPRNPIQLARLPNKAMTPVSAETDFVQNVRSNNASHSDTPFKNETLNNTYITKQESLACPNSLQRNPFFKIKKLLFNGLSLNMSLFFVLFTRAE